MCIRITTFKIVTHHSEYNTMYSKSNKVVWLMKQLVVRYNISVNINSVIMY